MTNPSSAAPNCSSNRPNSSSDVPKSSRSAQLEPFPSEANFTTLSRQTPCDFAPEKTPCHLSPAPSVSPTDSRHFKMASHSPPLIRRSCFAQLERSPFAPTLTQQQLTDLERRAFSKLERQLGRRTKGSARSIPRSRSANSCRPPRTSRAGSSRSPSSTCTTATNRPTCRPPRRPGGNQRRPRSPPPS